eukprot:CAMPEP_0172569406 /NCGR_PEP_ID=MMETSP1067-20121228/123328_1 /TAXON_ID=265564 ORGANISM="Thalassiosira punctigera, Strain Tpunct2005C2" /NCGR_SAMPLE_ID=MMETSP1067 /ASSEMBLY_ACC=CAM_ASM_000444 /LENGTH=81 /DNA_ID=CAMNT_0013361211 /DNA_START=66 /DNA_END=307 /DNA_ORIENTATION=-
MSHTNTNASGSNGLEPTRSSSMDVGETTNNTPSTSLLLNPTSAATPPPDAHLTFRQKLNPIHALRLLKGRTIEHCHNLSLS